MRTLSIKPILGISLQSVKHHAPYLLLDHRSKDNVRFLSLLPIHDYVLIDDSDTKETEDVEAQPTPRLNAAIASLSSLI